MAYKKETETDIQNAICAYLAAKKYLFWRQNSIPAVYEKNGKMSFRRLGKYALNGIPDIILVYRGQFVGLEVKRGSGSQSEAQKLFEKRCIVAGGHYHLVRSLDDVIGLEL